MHYDFLTIALTHTKIAFYVVRLSVCEDYSRSLCVTRDHLKKDTGRKGREMSELVFCNIQAQRVVKFDIPLKYAHLLCDYVQCLASDDKLYSHFAKHKTGRMFYPVFFIISVVTFQLAIHDDFVIQCDYNSLA